MIRESQNELVIKSTDKKISELRKNFSSLDYLFSSLSAIGDLAIFGGTVRDLVMRHESRTLRDIDIVVSVTSNDELIGVFQNLPFRRTRFGGFHCVVDGIYLDVWALGATWAFQQGLLEPYVENLPRSTFLSIDSIAVTLTDYKLYEYRFFESVKRKVIDIVLEKNPFPPLCVIRSLVLRKKYDFNFSQRLRNYIREFWKERKDPLLLLDETQFSHYGERVLSAKDIEKEMRKYVLTPNQ